MLDAQQWRSDHIVFVYDTLQQVLEDYPYLGKDETILDTNMLVVGDCYRVSDDVLKRLDTIKCGAGYTRERYPLHKRGELAWVYVLKEELDE